MANYENNHKKRVFPFDVGINITDNFFWWAKNKDRTLTIFKVEKGFVFRKATIFERVNFDYKNNEKIGKAINKQELKKVFMKSKFRQMFEMLGKSKSKKQINEEEFRFLESKRNEEYDKGIVRLVEMSIKKSLCDYYIFRKFFTNQLKLT